MAATIDATGADGLAYRIILQKGAGNTGTLRVLRWPAGVVPGEGEEGFDRQDAFDVYDVRASPAGDRLACKATIVGPDPTVVCLVTGPSASASAMVRVDVKTFLGTMSSTYAVKPEEYQELVDFIARSGFSAGAVA
jgi:hypothetical protein